MYQSFNEFLATIRAEAHFEPAARLLLAAVLEEVEGNIHGMGDVRLLRACLHLRGGDGYQGIVVVNQAGAEEPEALPSSSAWRWVLRGKWATLDVGTGTLTPKGLPPRTARPRMGPDTVLSLERRNATHVFALPARTSAGTIGGMLSVEVAAPGWSGQTLPLWNQIVDYLEFVSITFSPHVLSRTQIVPDPTPRDEFMPISGSVMDTVLATLRTFARLEEPVLLSGPSGVGKTALARWIHDRSRRRTGPFERVALGGLAPEEAARILFGSSEGTSPARFDEGLLARCAGGSVLLDDIHTWSLGVQDRLAEMITHGVHRDLDGRPHAIKCRLILATGEDLEEKVEMDEFRRALQIRLDALAVCIPPLAQRRDEILPWAHHFAEQLIEADESVSIDASAEALLLMAPWRRGNLEELRQVVVRAVAFARRQESADAVVTAQEVEQALGNNRPRSDLMRKLESAAEAWVDALLHTDPDLVDKELGVFRQLVRVRLADRTSPREAFERLQLTGTVRSRSHNRRYRDALEAVGAFAQRH